MSRRTGRPAETLARGVISLAGLLVASCHGSNDRAAPVVEGTPSFDCGTLDPQILVRCNDGEPDEVEETDRVDGVRPLPAGPAGFTRLVNHPCALGFTPGDTGFDTSAGLTVSCEPAGQRPGYLEQTITFESHVARHCGTGKYGSGAQVNPVWAGTLTLPDATATYRVELATSSQLDLLDRCQLWLDERPADAVRVAEEMSAIALFLRGGRPVAVRLDCAGQPGREGLNGVECFGYTPRWPSPPPVIDQTLIVRVLAGRCPEGCQTR